MSITKMGIGVGLMLGLVLWGVGQFVFTENVAYNYYIISVIVVRVYTCLEFKRAWTYFLAQSLSS